MKKNFFPTIHASFGDFVKTRALENRNRNWCIKQRWRRERFDRDVDDDGNMLALIAAAHNCSINILLISLLCAIHCIAAMPVARKSPSFPPFFPVLPPLLFLFHVMRLENTSWFSLARHIRYGRHVCENLFKIHFAARLTVEMTFTVVTYGTRIPRTSVCVN